MDNDQLRAALIKILDRLSENDRARLHLIFLNDTPRRLLDDLSPSGTLTPMELLLDQNIINEQNLNILIEALHSIQCVDAIKLLKGNHFLSY